MRKMMKIPTKKTTTTRRKIKWKEELRFRSQFDLFSSNAISGILHATLRRGSQDSPIVALIIRL